MKTYTDEKNESKCCNTCSRPIKDFWNFCPSCGNQLKEQILVLEYTRSAQSK